MTSGRQLTNSQGEKESDASGEGWEKEWHPNQMIEGADGTERYRRQEERRTHEYESKVPQTGVYISTSDPETSHSRTELTPRRRGRKQPEERGGVGRRLKRKGFI